MNANEKLVKDRLYGDTLIREQVLIDLINTRAMQRLAKVGQFGIPEEWNGRPGFSRLEHCIGVAILLARLKASVKEQIAGLLHDASHAAFSHVMDYVMGDPTEHHQDKIHAQYLKDNKELSSVLEKHGYTVAQFFDLTRYHLLEQNLPDLCADRIDYSLRELAMQDAVKARKCLDGLVVQENKIFFKNPETAKTFGFNFMTLQRYTWAETRQINRYHLLANVIKIALREKILMMEDLYVHDEHVREKLEAAGNKQIDNLVNSLKTDSFPVTQKPKKYRWVDPIVLENGRKKRLSQLDRKFKLVLNDYKNQAGLLA